MRESDLKPQFVLVIGGGGSGKNYFIANNPVYSQYKLIDVDAIKGEVGVSTAIGQIKPMLQAAFMKHENVVHPTTGGHLKGQENKIALAHEHGYIVTMVLIDTPIEVAIRRVRERVRSGGHDVELDKIVSSNEKARENFNALTSLVEKNEII